MWLSRIFIIIYFLSLLSGCNFRPLYAEHSKLNDKLCSIHLVELGNKRTDYELYNIIKQKLFASCSGQEQKLYNLHINLSEREQAVLLKRTGDTKRNMVILNASIRLEDKLKSQVLLNSDFYNTDSFNTLDSPFNEYVAHNNSIENASIGIADMIVNKLYVWFRDH